MRLAFDSRPLLGSRGVGRYARCLLQALRDTADAGTEIVETHRPVSADVFHSPWMDGAMLHCPCPMVVTVHDLAALKRRSEHLRAGVRMRLRQLAVQRAVRVIAPTKALARRSSPRRERATGCPSVTSCGSAASSTPTPASTSPSSRRRRARCRSCSSAQRTRGRMSFPA